MAYEARSKEHAAFRTWLLESVAGDSFVYHTGNLACDRQARKTVNRKAAFVADMADEGVVALTQRRVDIERGVCEYIATRLES